MHSPVPRGNAAITTDATVFRDRAATVGVGAFSESDERLSVGGLSALADAAPFGVHLQRGQRRIHILEPLSAPVWASRSAREARVAAAARAVEPAVPAVHRVSDRASEQALQVCRRIGGLAGFRYAGQRPRADGELSAEVRRAAAIDDGEPATGVARAAVDRSGGQDETPRNGGQHPICWIAWIVRLQLLQRLHSIVPGSVRDGGRQGEAAAHDAEEDGAERSHAEEGAD